MNKLLSVAVLAGSFVSLPNLSRAESYPVDVTTSYRLVGVNLWGTGRFTNMFASVPGPAKAYMYDPSIGYTFATKKGAGAWSADPGFGYGIGDAFYIQGGAPTTVTISGTPMTQIINDPPWATTTNLTLIGFDPLNNYYLRASQLFDQGNMARPFKYQEIMGAEPVNGVAVYKAFPSGVPAPPATPATTPGAWDVHVYNYGTWSGGEPTVVAGEGVWIGPAPAATALPIPWVFSTTPTRLNPDCGSTITLHGAGFSASSTVELLPGPIACTGPVVNAGGTELTATVPGSIAAGNYTIVVRNSATVASLPFGIAAGGPKINSIWPKNVGPCEPVNISLYGGGFCPGATLTATPLAGGAPVVATAVTVGPSGDSISGTFNFGASSPGMHSLTVQNSGTGGSDTRTYGVYLGGVEATLTPSVQYAGNCGPFTLALNGTICAGDEVRLVSNDGTTIIPGTVTALTAIWNGYKSMTADFDLNWKPVLEYHAELRRGTGPWTAVPGKLTVYDTSTCPLLSVVAGRTRVGFSRVNPYTIKVRNLGCSAVAASTLKVSFPASDNPAFTALSASGTAVSANEIDFAIPALAAGAVQDVAFSLQLPNVNTTCNMSVLDTLSGCNAMIIPIEVVASQDPNSKEGLEGIGTRHAIAGNETLPYEIHFENKASATAPAQDVFITDRLDPAKFDLSTFSLGEIKFGDRVITPPSGLTSYSEIITHDRDGNPATTADTMFVVLNGELVTDPASADLGRLTWSYRTLDPVTMETPFDPDLGFLPPNSISPIGEGSVKFSVKLNPGLSPGTRMGSEAVIIFDANAPISTNPWFNEISTNPILTLRQNGGQVEIEWVAAAGIYTLEETTQLGTGAAWTTVGTAPVSVSSMLQRVTLVPEGT